MALELRPNCELCDIDLPPTSPDARICTYECTFCRDCVEVVLGDVCPNCGGGFAPRPIRPAREWRTGYSLAHQPAGTRRHHTPYGSEELRRFSADVRHLPPGAR